MNIKSYLLYKEDNPLYLKYLNHYKEVVTNEGTNITLNNTIQAKMKIDLKGNTEQNGTPTPDFPQDVRVVTGNNSVKVIGKNLLDIQYFGNGSIDATTGQNISNNQNGRGNNYISVLPNTTYTLSCNKNVTNIRLNEYKSDKTHIKRDAENNTNYITITTTANTYYLRWSLNYDNSTIVTQTIIDNLDLQLEKGPTATPCKPYQSQTYPINLGTIELCKIDTYQDYIYKENGKWYKHSEIGKVVLDGSETGWAKGSTTSVNRYILNDFISNYNVTSLGFSNYFIKTNIPTTNLGTCYINTTQLVINFDAYNSSSTKDDFTTWLSTHNTIVYYVLATLTNTEITDTTLISQLNALSKAKSYNGTTYISSECQEGNVEMIISASALT